MEPINRLGLSVEPIDMLGSISWISQSVVVYRMKQSISWGQSVDTADWLGTG